MYTHIHTDTKILTFTIFEADNQFINFPFNIQMMELTFSGKLV